ncbi:MAG: aminotransferase class I/II-fold pyridoxal phosphate-dependent enzyme, partial [Candidatus Sericytochromatia bacterium]|nr:aminotransferase class I/II-fold pyridoxal phosphate-dependent enzyme [Candidatus Sericytochromatia bacterium]
MSKLDRLQRPDLLSPISRLDGLSPPRGDTHAGALPSHWSPLLQQQWFASITRRDEEKQYPSGANLRAALGEHLHCSVNSLCLSAGREAALIALLSAWCWQRPVLSPAPPPSHLLRAIRTLCLPHLTLAVRSDFSLPIDHVIQRARHHEAGAVFITNPADPSGSLLSRAEIITLADHCDALIIVDETNNIQPAFSVSDAVSTREN